MRELGRITPPTMEHAYKYPLQLHMMPSSPSPIFAGTNWYDGMFEPVWDELGHFWRLREDNLGAIAGGHAYIYKPADLVDSPTWWRSHNQGNTTKCVGFSAVRGMALFNREQYDPHEVYERAQRDYDPFEGTDYDGTTVSAGLDVLRIVGPTRVWAGKPSALGPQPGKGIDRNRWTNSVMDMAEAMHSPHYLDLGRFPMLNSWGADGHREGTRWAGRGWPHIVWVPLDLVDRLAREDGEHGVVTDR